MPGWVPNDGMYTVVPMSISFFEERGGRQVSKGKERTKCKTSLVFEVDAITNKKCGKILADASASRIVFNQACLQSLNMSYIFSPLTKNDKIVAKLPRAGLNTKYFWLPFWHPVTANLLHQQPEATLRY